MVREPQRVERWNAQTDACACADREHLQNIGMNRIRRCKDNQKEGRGEGGMENEREEERYRERGKENQIHVYIERDGC